MSRLERSNRLENLVNQISQLSDDELLFIVHLWEDFQKQGKKTRRDYNYLIETVNSSKIVKIENLHKIWRTLFFAFDNTSILVSLFWFLMASQDLSQETLKKLGIIILPLNIPYFIANVCYSLYLTYNEEREIKRNLQTSVIRNLAAELLILRNHPNKSYLYIAPNNFERAIELEFEGEYRDINTHEIKENSNGFDVDTPIIKIQEEEIDAKNYLLTRQEKPKPYNKSRVANIFLNFLAHLSLFLFTYYWAMLDILDSLKYDGDVKNIKSPFGLEIAIVSGSLLAIFFNYTQNQYETTLHVVHTRKNNIDFSTNEKKLLLPISHTLYKEVRSKKRNLKNNGKAIQLQEIKGNDDAYGKEGQIYSPLFQS